MVRYDQQIVTEIWGSGKWERQEGRENLFRCWSCKPALEI